MPYDAVLLQFRMCRDRFHGSLSLSLARRTYITVDLAGNLLQGHILPRMDLHACVR
jgi:hypothetical protein